MVDLTIPPGGTAPTCNCGEICDVRCLADACTNPTLNALGIVPAGSPFNCACGETCSGECQSNPCADPVVTDFGTLSSGESIVCECGQVCSATSHIDSCENPKNRDLGTVESGADISCDCGEACSGMCQTDSCDSATIRELGSIESGTSFTCACGDECTGSCETCAPPCASCIDGCTQQLYTVAEIRDISVTMPESGTFTKVDFEWFGAYDIRFRDQTTQNWSLSGVDGNSAGTDGTFNIICLSTDACEPIVLDFRYMGNTGDPKVTIKVNDVANFEAQSRLQLSLEDCVPTAQACVDPSLKRRVGMSFISTSGTGSTLTSFPAATGSDLSIRMFEDSSLSFVPECIS